MAENQRKIEEQQKKMVSVHFFMIYDGRCQVSPIGVATYGFIPHFHNAKANNHELKWLFNIV